MMAALPIRRAVSRWPGGLPPLILPVLLAAAVALFAAHPVQAQDTADAGSPPIPVEGGTQVVQGPAETALPPALPGSGDLPGSRVFIPRERFLKSQRTVADVLAALPGVAVVRSGDQMAPARVRIRGSRADQVLVLVDGVPLAAPADRPGERRAQGETGVDLAAIPLERVASIEVLRGGASADYGPGAAAGAVLIRLREPTRTRFAISRTVGSGGYRETQVEGEGTLRSGESADGAPRLRAALNQRSSLGRYVYYDADAAGVTESTPDAALACRKDLGGGYFERRCNEQERVALDLDLALGERQRWQLSVEQQERHGLGGVESPLPDGEETRTHTALRYRDGTLLGQESLVELGWSLSAARTNSDRQAVDSDPNGTFSSGYADESGQGALWAQRWWGAQRGRLGVELAAQELRDDRFRATREQQSLLGQWSLHAAAGSAEAALRHDAFSDLPGQSSVRLAGTRRVGVHWGLKGSAGTGYRPPSLYELYDPGSGGSASSANPDLRAEHTESADAGLFLEWVDTSWSELLVFQQRSTDAIVLAATAADPNRLRFTNLEETRTEGAELAHSTRLAAAWTLEASATWNDARIVASDDAREEGQRVPGVPEQAWRAALLWQAERWSASGTLRYQGRRFIDAANSRYLEAYHVLDAGLGAPLPAGFSLRAEARNLGNTAYSELDNHPAPGRELLITLRWDWPTPQGAAEAGASVANDAAGNTAAGR